jgi:hypothetical protein
MSRTITILTEGGGEFSARHGIDASVAYHAGDTESYLGEAQGRPGAAADAPRRRASANGRTQAFLREHLK